MLKVDLSPLASMKGNGGAGVHDYEIHEFPISEVLGRLTSEVENDRDVAYGALVTGYELDMFEAIDRELQAAFLHQMLFGYWPGSPTLAKNRRPNGQAIFL
ncbi:MAG: hypothetical protein KGL39_46480 [Patescibacteria group bacterium]|nr:hypothetical protein [Patescibacteria group bacterium]